MAKSRMLPDNLKALGTGGSMYAVTPDEIVLVIPHDTRAKAQAQASRSGKTRILATTNGFQPIPGTDAKVSLNVTLPMATA